MILNKFINKTGAKAFSFLVALVMVVGIGYGVGFSGSLKASASSSLDNAELNALPTMGETASKIAVAVAADNTVAGFVYSESIPMSRELQEFTYKKCMEQGLDYPVVLALIERESNFNVHAVGYNSNGTKDSGIMQINDVNRGWLSRELGITDLMNPYNNITAGTTYLGNLREKYGHHYAFLAYQSGEQGMLNRVSAGRTTSVSVEKLYTKAAGFEKLIEAI